MYLNKNKLPLFCLFFIGLAASCSQAGTEQTETRTVTAAEKPGHSDAENLVSLTPEQMQSVNIELGSIEQKELTATIKANGQLSVPNNRKANATSLYGGVIKTLKVQVGSYVKRGQVIATIENPEYIQLQEDYLTTVERITFAEQEDRRQRELYAGNAGALKNLQNASAELRTLRTRKASLQRQLALMGISAGSVTNGNLRSQLTVTSPITGVISDVFAKIGSYVDVSSPVAEIVDNSALHLDLQVFEKDLPQLKVGQIIHFTLTNNPAREYDARVFSIGSSFANDSKTVAIHCEVTGDKAGLIDGMNITGIISLNEVTSPAVPQAAVVSADGKQYIFVQRPAPANADMQHKEQFFERVEVISGVTEMGYTAITPVQNIAAGAKIVTRGAFFVNAKITNIGEDHH